MNDNTVTLSTDLVILVPSLLVLIILVLMPDKAWEKPYTGMPLVLLGLFAVGFGGVALLRVLLIGTGLLTP